MSSSPAAELDICRGYPFGEVVLEGVGAEGLRARVREAVPVALRSTEAVATCHSAPSATAFGQRARRAATLPFLYPGRPVYPRAVVSLMEHEGPTSAAIAEEYARSGGPAKRVLGPDDTPDPDLVFDSRLLAESRLAGGRRVWVYETLQTLCGVMWSPDGTTALMIAQKGDSKTDGLAAEVQGVLTAIARSG